jgi:hypothetical protein
MFTLPKVAATLASVTNRTERHGEEDVPAVSLGLIIEGPNTLLDSLSPTLRTTLYEADDSNDIPGIDKVTSKLRTDGIEYVAGSGVLEGWTVVVDHGIDDETAVVLKSSKLDKWRVAPKQGGMIEFSFRVGSSHVDPRIMGLLAFKVGQEVTISIKPPKPGTVEAKAKEQATSKAAKKQKAQEAAGQQRIAATKTPEQALADAVAGGA